MMMKNIEIEKKRSNWLKSFVEKPGIINRWLWMLLLRLMQRRENFILRL